MHGDPKGGVPKWLVNMFQTEWARDTLEAALTGLRAGIPHTFQSEPCE